MMRGFRHSERPLAIIRSASTPGTLLARRLTNPLITVRASSAQETCMATVKRIPQESLHISKPTWWLESRFHFSFADHYDPVRNNFGVLRVVNDDLVKGQAGFGTHPHRDTEIFSYVVEGKLSHQDNLGNKEALPRGSVQFLSAGSGIAHSEMNEQAEAVRFLQVWLSPDRRGHKPQYGSQEFKPVERHNRLLSILRGSGPLPSWTSLSEPSKNVLHQDANVLVSEADAGVSYDLELGPSRQAYLVCIEGSLKLGDVELNMRDAAEIVGQVGAASPLCLTAGHDGAHFLVVEMALA